MAITYSDIGLEEPSTITNRVGTVTVTRNSTAQQQELLSLADPQTTNAIGRITDTTPDSTMFGVVVREAVPQSTTVNVSSVSGVVFTSPVSTASVRVHQSTAADLNVTVAGYVAPSTTVNVSSVSGVVFTSPVSTASVRVQQSTAADLLVTATIGTNLQSTSAPSSGSSGLVVRQVIDALTTFASTSALASTVVELQSSAAGIRTYVTAYTITSTNQTPAHWGFFSSNGTLLWPITMAALSSAVTGANLAVAPPGYLFRTAASDALNFKTAGSTVAGVQLGVSFFRAP